MRFTFPIYSIHGLEYFNTASKKRVVKDGNRLGKS